MKKVLELFTKQISKEKFLKINAISDIKDVIAKGLVEAYHSKNAEAVEDLIILIYTYEIFDEGNINILNKLLLSDWHYKHEDIALLLEELSSIESIQYLYDAIELRPHYLTWDENFPFEVKCVRAIYYIGKEKAYPYLEKLCKHPNCVIREMAQRQIRKLM